MTTKGTKEFAQSASSAYKTMTASQKEELRKKYEKTLTVQNIKCEGRKMKNIESQVHSITHTQASPWFQMLLTPWRIY